MELWNGAAFIVQQSQIFKWPLEKYSTCMTPRKLEVLALVKASSGHLPLFQTKRGNSSTRKTLQTFLVRCCLGLWMPKWCQRTAKRTVYIQTVTEPEHLEAIVNGSNTWFCDVFSWSSCWKAFFNCHWNIERVDVFKSFEQVKQSFAFKDYVAF